MSIINVSTYSGTIGNLTINGTLTKDNITTNGIYVPNTWGSFWKPKLLAAKTGTATIAVVGDSIGQGFYASDLSTSTTSDTWVGKLRTSLQSTYGDGGSGFIGVAMSMNAFVNGNYTSTNTQVSSTIAGWTSTAGFGDGPGCIDCYTNVNGRTFTFSVVRGTNIAVYYGQATTTGSFTVTIDGTVVGTINSNNATQGLASTSYTVAAGNHVVVITTASNPNYTTLFGVRGTNATGVIVDNFSTAGTASGDWAQVATGKSGYGNPIYWSGGAGIPCDLFIYSLGVNDAHNTAGSSPAASVSAYGQNIVSAFEYLKNNAANYNSLGTSDLLYIAPAIGKAQAASPGLSYGLMLAQALPVCEAYGAAVISLGTIFRNSWSYFNSLGAWGNASAADGSTGTDIVHPSTVGSNLYFQTIYNIVKKTS